MLNSIKIFQFLVQKQQKFSGLNLNFQFFFWLIFDLLWNARSRSGMCLGILEYLDLNFMDEDSNR